MTRRSPTSSDIARLCGVSQPTVSYVLNNTPGKRVSAATRERVLRAAAELGYTPSRAAQTLARGRSRIVILHAPPGPRASIAADFFGALSQRLETAGWTLLSHYPPVGDGRAHLRRLVRATGADAVLDAYGDAIDDEALQRSGVTVARLMEPAAWQATLEVPVRLQLEHLTGLGHRTIAFAAPDDEAEQVAVRIRLATARDWLGQQGFEAPRVVTWTGELDAFVVALRDAVQNGVTAVAAHNDDTAVPVLAAAAGLGLAVPGQLAVVGVDDTPLAPMTVPPLSTVRLSAGSDAIDAVADRLLALLQGTDASAAPPPPAFELVRRRST